MTNPKPVMQVATTSLCPVCGKYRGTGNHIKCSRISKARYAEKNTQQRKEQPK
jgi:hypothetical protein